MKSQIIVITQPVEFGKMVLILLTFGQPNKMQNPMDLLHQRAPTHPYANLAVLNPWSLYVHLLHREFWNIISVLHVD
jgi:hypothetical protein